MKKSFSLIELIIVIIIVGILYSSANISLKNTNLNQAADQLMFYLNYTKHLAIIDNKMQYYPINNGVIEMNRSKYWFKQWWQLRFSRHKNDNGEYEYWYEIFSDQPYTGDNFDKSGNTPTNDILRNLSYARNPLTKQYLTGLGKNDDKNYPDNYDPKLNLTKTYNIHKVLINGYNITYSKAIHRFIFDSYGNCYTDYKESDAGDINPYDKNIRKPLLKTAKITLCQDENCNKNINICISAKIANIYICE